MQAITKRLTISTAACLTGIALLAPAAHAQCGGWAVLNRPADTRAFFGAGKLVPVDIDGIGPEPESLVSLNAFCSLENSGEFNCRRLHILERGDWRFLGELTYRPTVPTDTGAMCATAFGGELIVGGGFGSIAGVPASGLAGYANGSWREIGGGVDGQVFAATVWRGKLIIAGNFTVLANSITTSGVAAWDGQNWQNLGAPSWYDGYKGLLVRDDRLIAVPTRSGGVLPTVVYDGTTWQPLLTQNVSGTLSSAFFVGDDFYIAVLQATSSSPNLGKIGPSNSRTWCLGACPEYGNSSVTGFVAYDSDRDGAPELFAAGYAYFVSTREYRYFFLRGHPGGEFDLPFSPPPGGNFPSSPLTTYAGELVSFSTRYISGAPYVFEQPRDRSACGRRTAAFSTTITNTLTPPTFRWQRNGIPLSDGPTPWGSTILGSESAQLTIRSPRPQDLGTYRCIITNSTCGSTQTREATLTGCQADINCDSQTDFADYLDFIDNFANETAAADFDASGTVDFFDYLDFVEALAGGC